MVLKRLVERQEGMTLVIAVIVLITLTMIGLAAVLSSNIAMDVSGNLKAKSSAFHAADACLNYQIRRIKDSGVGTTALTQTLGNGLSCTASAPTSTGGIAGGGTQVGYSLETGASSLSYATYSFTVTGSGPRNTTARIDAVVNLPTTGGGY